MKGGVGRHVGISCLGFCKWGQRWKSRNGTKVICNFHCCCQQLHHGEERISPVNGGNRHQQKTLPAFKIPYSLFPVMGEALCHHLLSPGTPLQHLQLLVPTFQFAPLQRIPDLVSQTLTATWTAFKSKGRTFAHFTTASKWLLGCFLMKTFTERHKQIFHLNSCETRVVFIKKSLSHKVMLKAALAIAKTNCKSYKTPLHLSLVEFQGTF